MSNELDMLRRLRRWSMAEACTLSLLVFVAVPMKHLLDMPGLVHVLGPLHGLVFCAYGAALCEALAAGRLPSREAGRLFMLALLPFGSYLRLRRTPPC